jgi:hypothetical protein
MHKNPFAPFNFKIESHNHKVRLIILKGDLEIACRTEQKKNVSIFLHSTGERIFKGRLQLISNQNEILVFVKNDLVYKISKEAFAKKLHNA